MLCNGDNLVCLIAHFIFRFLITVKVNFNVDMSCRMFPPCYELKDTIFTLLSYYIITGILNGI